MKKGEEMEMIIVVLVGSNQYSMLAQRLKSEVCPPVPGPHQSWGEELQQETLRFLQANEECRVSVFLLFTLNQLGDRRTSAFTSSLFSIPPVILIPSVKLILSTEQDRHN